MTQPLACQLATLRALARSRRCSHTRALGLLALTVTLIAGAAMPSLASARWAHIAKRPSAVEPYFACARQRARAHCDLIADPTRGLAVSGPLRAGAITEGPALDVSPALSGNGVDGGYSPENLRDAYELPSSSGGAGQTVAVVDAYNDPDAESDMSAYRSHYKLAECTTAGGCFRKVNEAGGSAMPTSEPEWAEEISLDLDMVSAICPSCHILLVETSNEESASFAEAENEAAKLGATEISNSYGFELSSEPTYGAAFDHPGIPITVASGDEGYRAEWPADNPDVIAVGGTTLTTASNSRRWQESVWSESGSGCSREPKPAWQTDKGCSYRTNNDVAAVADPNTPVSTYDSYKQESPYWQLFGGTSVATPIVASAMALATPYTRLFEGAKALYVEAALNGSGVLDDVVSGKNGNCGNYLCEGKVGYDGPSGLGSLEGAPEVPPPSFTTKAAGSITTTSAALNATIAPNGAEVQCVFEYGTSSSYGSSVPCSTPTVSGTASATVTGALSALKPDTLYDYRITGSYFGTSGSGAGASFTTAPAAPQVATKAASALTQSSATLNASVDPNGETVSACWFEYGTTSAYGTRVECQSPPGSGQAPVAVSAPAAALQANQTYHFRIAATNAEGTTYGGDREFTTLARLASAVTGAPSEVTLTTASLNATVDPDGVPVSSCRFEYGESPSYESSAPCTPSLLGAEGQSPVETSAAIGGLVADRTYHFRIAATNSEGTSYGSDETLTTLPYAPTVLTGAAAAITEGSATISATVSPNGAALASCLFQYGASEAGISQSSVPCSSFSEATGGTSVVSASLVGLLPGTAYSYRFLASNAGGASYGAVHTFTTTATSALEKTGLGGSNEHTNTTGGPGAPGGPSGTPAPACLPKLAQTSLTATSTGVVTVKVRCPAGERSYRGRITLRTLDALAAGKRAPARILTLAAGSFTVAGGQLAAIRLQLAASAWALVSRSRVLRARLTITPHSSAGGAHSARATVTLRVPSLRARRFRR